MTLANDLVSYSIMMNGDKAVSHVTPHYAPLSSWNPAKITLPSISLHVRLPDTSLTENNLKLHDAYSLRTPSALSNPLLASLGLSRALAALALPLSSPRLCVTPPQLSAAPMALPLSVPQLTAQLAAYAGAPAPRKRRQRLGPSCDNCRLRKVKCDADVVLLSRTFPQCDMPPEYLQLSPDQKLAVADGRAVHTGHGFALVFSNGKLIKYKCCLSCGSKGLECGFSKGFTKEDIGHSKRAPDADVVLEKKKSLPVRVVKRAAGAFGAGPSSRKSLCLACRKRKVKCVMNRRLNRCAGCIKKDCACSLEAC